MQRYLKEKFFETNYWIFGYLWGSCHPWPVVALVGSKMVNPWFSRNILQKNNKYTIVDPLKPHTGFNQPWRLVGLKGSKMVNPGLAQVIQHKDIYHTSKDLCVLLRKLSTIQNANSKITTQKSKIKLQDPKSEFQNPKPKLQNKNSKIQNQNSKIKTPKSKLQNQNSKIQNQNSRSWGKPENGQLIHIIVSKYSNIQGIVFLNVFKGRMLKAIAKYAYQHEGGENHSRPLVSEPGVGLK